MSKNVISSNGKIQEILDDSKHGLSNILTEVESKKVLSYLGLSVPSIDVAVSEFDAIEMSEKIGYPVVLKIVSPQITHKSDAGCVKVNIKNEEEVKIAYQEIIENAKNYNPSAEIEGVSVQPLVRKGTEVIVGMKRDEVFGPVILFGLGGIFVEVVKDFSLKVVPLTKNDITEMISELKGFPLLNGYRGEEEKDLKAIEEIIEKIAYLSKEFPEIEEIDLNPVFVYEKGNGASIVDARIILR